jgi:hypothetical protein
MLLLATVKKQDWSGVGHCNSGLNEQGQRRPWNRKLDSSPRFALQELSNRFGQEEVTSPSTQEDQIKCNPVVKEIQIFKSWVLSIDAKV